MKNYVSIIFALASLLAVACNSDDSGENDIRKSWNATEEFVGSHGSFDTAAIPAELLKIGMICCEDEWYCKSGKLYYYDTDERIGWEPARVIFFEDGTCWQCWHEVPGGPKYRVYTWSYDPETAIITTSYAGDDTEARYQNLKAQVKAFDGTSMILDGNLCNSAGVYGPVKEGGDEHGYGYYPDFGIYLRMFMKSESAETLRWWIDNAVKSNGMGFGM